MQPVREPDAKRAQAEAMVAEVRAAAESDREAVLALIREMIPGVDAEARWRWLYAGNPGGPALTWMAYAQGGLAGCTSFFPFRMWLDGAEVRVALGGDGYVRPASRRGGVGFALHDASRNAMAAAGIGCMYGAPGAMNVTPLKHGGSRELGHVARWVRPIRAAALGTKTLGTKTLGTKTLGTKTLGTKTLATKTLATKALSGLALSLAGPSSARLEAMQPDDARIDRVWAAARENLRLAAVRDAKFYTWRFLQAPAGREPAFVIVRRGQPIGACAYELTSGAVLRIIDLVTVPGAWHAGLRAIVGHALAHTAATAVDLKLFALDGRRRQLWRSGFIERESKPFLCMIPPGGDRRFLDPERWFYTGADSDLDTID